MEINDNSATLYIHSAARTRNRADKRYLMLIVILWSLPIILTLLSGSENQIIFSTLLAGVFSFGLALVRPAAVLLAVPFFALLAPMGGFYAFAGVRLILTDWLFFILIPQISILLYVKKRAQMFRKLERHSSAIQLFPLLLLFILSCITGLLFSTLDSLKPLIYSIQLVIIYLYFMLYVDSETYLLLIIRSWIIATFLGALILIQSFLTGKLLLNFAMQDSEQFFEKDVVEFFRASYYYAGFHFALGIAIVIIFFKIILSKNNTLVIFSNIIILLVLGVALVLTFNKSALFSMLITIIMIFLYLWTRFRKELSRQSFIFLFIIVLVVIALVNNAGSYLFPSADLMLENITSGGSLIARFNIVQSALTAYVSYPIQMIIGMGPTFIESGNQLIASQFKVSSVAGNVEGTVDSGWIFYLIELGVISLILFLILIEKSIKILFHYIKVAGYLTICNSPSLWIFGGIIFTVIELLTQTLGYSKIFWLPFQLILMAFFYRPYVTSSNAKICL